MSEQGNLVGPPVADRQSSWVDRLPSSVRDFAVLARWDRPIGTWLLLLPCWWGVALAPTWPDPLLLGLLAVGAVAMRGAGCTINDLADRDLDRQVTRTAHRPLAAGRLTATQAIAFVAVQMLVGLGVVLCLSWTAALIAVASLPLVVAYPFMKRVTWWPQAFLGVTFNWGVLAGYAEVTGELSAAAALLYLAGIFWTLGYDTIYAHQDKEDDALIGVRSTALLLGTATRPWLWTFYGLMLLLLAVAAVLAGKGILCFLGLVAAATLLGRQVVAVDLDDPGSCLAHFRANRLVGLVVFAALVGGSVPV